MTAPKKATVSRAATKATTKKATKRVTPPAPVVADGETAPIIPNGTITFMGREIIVSMPEAEQLVAWDSLTKRVQRRDPNSVTMADAVKFTGQLYTIIESVMVDPEDVDWLWELRATKKVGLEEASEIITKAMKVFEAAITGQPQNRAARRAKA